MATLSSIGEAASSRALLQVGARDITVFQADEGREGDCRRQGVAVAVQKHPEAPPCTRSVAVSSHACTVCHEDHGTGCPTSNEWHAAEVPSQK